MFETEGNEEDSEDGRGPACSMPDFLFSFLSSLFMFAVLALVYITIYYRSFLIWVLRDQPNPVTPCRRVGVKKRVFPTSSRLHLRVPSGRAFLFLGQQAFP